MVPMIQFTPQHNPAEAGHTARHSAVANALRRHLPHIVSWHCPQDGAPVAVCLPDSINVRDLLRESERARLRLIAPADVDGEDHAIELHYAHLTTAEIEEGIRRLGRCLLHCTDRAMRSVPGAPTVFIGN